MNNLKFTSNNYLKKILWVILITLSLYIINSSLLIRTVSAVCPVCTVAVVAGLGLSRYLGVDDTISGVWIGGLILSSSFWFADWIGKQSKFKIQITKFVGKIKFLTVNQFIALSVILIMYLFVLLPLYWTHIIGHPLNRFWEIDKLVLGTAVGSLAFLIAIWKDKKVRKIYGKQLFNYQKVVFPVGSLIIASTIFYFITK